MSNYLKHPTGNLPAPRIFGRWMVTGPEFEDGSGWSMCQHENDKCQKCVASFSDEDDATETARILDKWDTAIAQGREAAKQMGIHLAVHLREADAAGKMTTVVDETVPDDTIIIEKDGQEVARLVGIAMEPEEPKAPQVTHELSGVARPYKGLPKPQ